MGTKLQSVSSPRTYAVLCVDDHVPGLKIRKIFLESFGYTVQTVASGREALELAGKHHFDVAVLDYRMPDMDGLELARRLRQRFPALPMVLLSGYVPGPPRELHGLIDGYVAKGSHPEVLLEQLAKVLGRSPRKRRRATVSTDELLRRSHQHLAESKRQVQRAVNAATRAKRGARQGRRTA